MVYPPEGGANMMYPMSQSSIDDMKAVYRLFDKAGSLWIGPGGEVCAGPTGAALRPAGSLVRACFVYSWCSMRTDDFPRALNDFKAARIEGSSSVNMQMRDVHEIVSGVSRLRAFKQGALARLASLPPALRPLVEALRAPCVVRAELSDQRDKEGCALVRIKARSIESQSEIETLCPLLTAVRLLMTHELASFEMLVWDVAHSAAAAFQAPTPAHQIVDDDDLLRECQHGSLAFDTVAPYVLDSLCARLENLLSIAALD